MADKSKDSPSIFERFSSAASNATMFTPAGMVDRLVGPQVRLTVRDFARDSVGFVVSGYDALAGNKSGDTMVSTRVTHLIENFWNNHISANNGDGKFDFRMAGGWTLPEGVPYNGRPVAKEAAGSEIASRTAIFLRNKSGALEVLDHHDPRWYGVVPVYVAAQLGVTVASGGIGGAAGKVATGERLAATFARNGLNVAGKTLAGAELASSGIVVADSLKRGLILKPEAVERFARIMENPEKLTLGRLTEDINTIIHDYSFDRGPSTEQYYIPSLKGHQNTLNLLDQLTRGRASGFERAHPFDEIKDFSKKDPHYKDDLRVMNLADVRENPYFQMGFFKVASNALTQGKLTPQEHLAFRFGLKMIYDDNISIASNDPTGSGKLLLSDKDMKDSLRTLKAQVSVIIAQEQAEAKALKAGVPKQDAEEQGRQAAVAAAFEEPRSDKEILAFVQRRADESSSTVAKIEAQKLAQAQMQAQAMSMAFVIH